MDRWHHRSRPVHRGAVARPPVVLTGLALVDPHGDGKALRAKMLDILEKGNESGTEFLVTSRYRIASLQR